MTRVPQWLQLPENRSERWSVVIAILLIVAAGAVLTAYVSRPVVNDYTLTVPARGDQPGVELDYGTKPALTNYTFFQKVQDRFIDQKAQFLSVNLNTMRIELYEDGEKKLEVPVKAKGERGSWWETPAGLYKIRTKERDHITSFGGLHMPWSMQFHGNFFIHGWPYFDDGRDVTGDTSAGCIRLSDQSARRLYSHVNVGTPVLVYEEGMTENETTYTYTSQDLDLGASSYLVADIKNHQSLVSDNTEDTQSMSVLSNLLVGLTASEWYGLEDTMNAPTDIGTSTALTPGGTYRAYDLFFPLLQTGSTGAARGLASYRGHEWFMNAVNERATSLGMSNTKIDSLVNLDDNTSSPRDLFALAKYLYNYRSFLLTIGAGTVDTGLYGKPWITPANDNRFSSRSAFKGGITLPANDEYDVSAALAVYTIPFDGGTRPLAFIAMDSETPAEDIETMYQHVKNTYSLHATDEVSHVPADRRTDRINASYSNQNASVFDAVRSFLSW